MTLKIRIVPVNTHEIIKAFLGLKSTFAGETSPIYGVIPSGVGGPLVHLYGFAPDMAAEIAMNSVKLLGPVLTKKLNAKLADNDIEIELTDVKLDFGDKYLSGITLELGHIGYKGLAKHFLPIIPDYLPEDYAPLVRGILGIVGDDDDRLVSAVLDSLSDGKKEEILKLTIRERNADICDGISDFAQGCGIDLEVAGVDVR